MSKVDPTRTKTLRKRFERFLRVRYKFLGRRINELLVSQDAFGLIQNIEVLVPEIAARQWEFETSSQQVDQFEQWIAEDQAILFPSGEILEEYIVQGYEKGAARAFTETQRAQLEVALLNPLQRTVTEITRQSFLAGAFTAPETVEKLKILVGRTFTDIQGVNSVLAVRLKKHLADGLVQGDNPRTIARRMASDIGKSIKHAERIARTEVIRAHAEGQLDMLERMGVEEVGVAVEWTTAGDHRVCQLCGALEGVVLKVSESHGLIPRHPNCRCAFRPANVGESKQGQIRSRSGINSRIQKSLQREKNSSWAGRSRSISKTRPESILE